MTLKFDRITGNVQLYNPDTETVNLSEIMEILELRKWAIERALQLNGMPLVGSLAPLTATSITADAEKIVLYVLRGPNTTDAYLPPEPTP